jgi:hypothetical protein
VKRGACDAVENVRGAIEGVRASPRGGGAFLNDANLTLWAEEQAVDQRPGQETCAQPGVLGLDHVGWVSGRH